MMWTYITLSESGEYYCGKTKCIATRMRQHEKEKKPHWFAFKNRREFTIVLILEGDYEKCIKRFGVKKYLESLYSKVEGY